MPPSRPRAFCYSRASANGPRAVRKPASTSMMSRPVQRLPFDHCAVSKHVEVVFAPFAWAVSLCAFENELLAHQTAIFNESQLRAERNRLHRSQISGERNENACLPVNAQV